MMLHISLVNFFLFKSTLLSYSLQVNLAHFCPLGKLDFLKPVHGISLHYF